MRQRTIHIQVRENILTIDDTATNDTYFNSGGYDQFCTCNLHKVLDMYEYYIHKFDSIIDLLSIFPRGIILEWATSFLEMLYQSH